MASSGTLAEPTIDVRAKIERGDGAVLVSGRVRIKSTATIEAGDFHLKTIKTALFSPYDPQPLTRSGGPPVLYGSITGGGSLMNSVRVRSFRGSIVPHTGTQHVGTAAGGTLQAGFVLIGA